MTEDLMKMASFRIDRDLWAKFGSIAKRERLTVTDVLTDYIQRCTDNDKTEYAVNTGNDLSVSTDNYDTDKLNNAVMTRINEAIDNRVLHLIESATARVVADELLKTSTDATALEELVKVNIEPLADLLAEVEAYTKLQIEAVREELKKALSDRYELPTDTIAKSPTIPSKTKLVANEPEWVNSDNRGFYKKLVGNSELLDKVAEAIDSASGNNAVLAESLVRLGFHKQDGKPLGSDVMSRIRKVVSHLKTKPESTLLLSPE